MKKNILLLAIITYLSGCATIHEMSAPKNEVSTQKNQAKKQNHHAKLASQASAWLGETVTIESVDKGFIQTDFVAVTKRGKKLSCFYTGFFGVKVSSIVCG
jgi:uncharacterized protein YceK